MKSSNHSLVPIVRKYYNPLKIILSFTTNFITFQNKSDGEDPLLLICCVETKKFAVSYESPKQLHNLKCLDSNNLTG